MTTFGSLGDLHPYIAIAMELQRRGHEAVIATSKLYRERVEAEGIVFAPMRPDIADIGDSDEVIKKVFDLRSGPAFIIRNVLMPHLRASFEDLTVAVHGADFLISHMLTFAGPLVAEKQKLKWAASVLAPLSLFSAYDPPILPPLPALGKLRKFGPLLFGPLFLLMKYSTKTWTRPVRELRREIGLPPACLDPLYDGQFSPALNLVLFSSTLAAAQPDWPVNSVTTGFPFYDRHEQKTGMSASLNRFLDGGPAPIVFTLGSSAVMDAGRFFAESVGAAQRLGKRAVLLVGSHPRNLFKLSMPESIIAIEYAPYSELFPRAAAVVHQGGVGTTGQAMRAGCPMVVVPYGFDQPDNADRVARLGVAMVITRYRYTASSAADALSRVLTDGSYRRKAEGVGLIVKQETGTETACDNIERVLKSDPIMNSSSTPK